MYNTNTGCCLYKCAMWNCCGLTFIQALGVGGPQRCLMTALAVGGCAASTAGHLCT